MMLNRRSLLRLLMLGATATASGLLLPAPVLAATSRRTGTNENISTLKASGGDYTAPGTWEAATDNDLVSATTTEVLECYADGSPYTISGTLTIAGATTNSTYRRIVRCAPGQGYNGIPGNGVVFSSTSDANMWSITEANFQLQDLTIQLLSNTGSTARTAVVMNGTSGLAVGLLVKATHSGSSNIGMSTNADLTKIINCLVYECDGHGIRMIANTGKTHYLYNDTVVACGDEGYSLSNAADIVAIMKNCLGSGNSTADFDPDPNMEHCASSDSTADNGTSPTNCRVDQTFTFVNAGGDDYHLATNDAGAKGFGTSLAADATFPFDDDVDGNLITTWSIGFDAHLAVGAKRRRVFRW
jgi:hypothetical protein